ncbi:hypothetical protein D9Q98_004080 [Chlorella vulgaris]|uniref:Uncharacterized protein n=1 Tax=Chlorella vulgaris TaxID=3077 RepID=A0A9D4TR20_CHLVU|nr:hypothetical protein D9Q98_004080 [Chlorella vulgaris]
MQSGKPVIEPPNYQSMLQEFQAPPQQGQNLLSGPPQDFEAPVQQQFQSPWPEQSQPMHNMNQMQQMNQMHHMMQPAAAQVMPVQQAPEAPQSWVGALIASNKAMLAVIAITLVLVMFVLPRLVRMPRFATYDGRLNLLGSLAASAGTGVAYKLAMSFTSHP